MIFAHKLAILKIKTKQKNISCHKTEKKTKDYIHYLSLAYFLIKILFGSYLSDVVLLTNFTFFTMKSNYT